MKNLKNQYFGDTRDLFKYDLILEILLRNKFLKQFTFVPMLTENDESFHGGKTSYRQAKAGTQRTELRNFLERCVSENRRNISELERFFKTYKFGRKIDFAIYKKDEYFSHDTRMKYFEEINGQTLCKSVVLADPDVGLEVKSMKGKEEKYVKYHEVKYLHNRMDKNSVLVVFQFIPRVKREKYFPHVCKKLKKAVNDSPICYISDNQVAFFILTKYVKVQRLIMGIICRYGKIYALITGKSI